MKLKRQEIRLEPETWEALRKAQWIRKMTISDIIRSGIKHELKKTDKLAQGGVWDIKTGKNKLKGETK